MYPHGLNHGPGESLSVCTLMDYTMDRVRVKCMYPPQGES